MFSLFSNFVWQSNRSRVTSVVIANSGPVTQTAVVTQANINLSGNLF